MAARAELVALEHRVGRGSLLDDELLAVQVPPSAVRILQREKRDGLAEEVVFDQGDLVEVRLFENAPRVLGVDPWEVGQFCRRAQM